MARISALWPWAPMLIFVMAGCSAETGPPTVAFRDTHTEELCRDNGTANAHQIQYCGVIDDAFVEFLNTAIKEDTSELMLTSQGGLVEPAMEARRILDQRGIALRLRRLCVSACAQYVFLPDRKPTVEPDTLVAFHGTSAALEMTTSNVPGAKDAVWRSRLAELAAAERRFYESYGLSEN